MAQSNSQSPNAGSISTGTSFVSSRSKVPSRQAIALISDHADPATATGKEEAGAQNVYVRQVGEALAKLGWQVDMFTRKVNPDDPTIVQHAPHCRTIRLVAGPQEFVPRDQVFSYMPEFVAAFQKFQSKEGANYPLVHTNYWLSAWIGMQLKQESNIQLVHTYHSVGAVKYRTLPKSAIADTRLRIEREILEQANCIVATSPQELEALRSSVSDRGAVEIIPAGTDTHNFRTIPKAEARAKLGFDLNEQIVLYVGRFDARKGIDTLVRACAQLKEHLAQLKQASSADSNTSPQSALRLVLAGGSDPDQMDREERQRIEQLVQETGLEAQTLFAGQVGHDLLPYYYTAADVCVIPSHYEPFGLVALEAMACGTPVVASDVGGLKFTIIPEETGLLVPPQDVDGFAAAIARVLTDEVWARKLRRQASARVQQNFSWMSVAARLSNLYRHLLAQSITHELLWTEPPIQREVTPAAAVLTAPVVTEELGKVS